MSNYGGRTWILTFGMANGHKQLQAMDRCTRVGHVITEEDAEAFEGASNFYSELRHALKENGAAEIVRRGRDCEERMMDEGPTLLYEGNPITIGKEYDCHPDCGPITAIAYTDDTHAHESEEDGRCWHLNSDGLAVAKEIE